MLTLESTTDGSRTVVRVVSDNPKTVYACQADLESGGYSTHVRKGGIKPCGK